MISCCCDSSSVRVSQMAVKLKSGRMLHFKKRLFGKDWRKVHIALFNDSTLVWFKDKDNSQPDGGVVIKDAPELMAFGKFTSRIPNRPPLPHGYSETELIAFGSRGRETVHWFLAKNEDEIKEWLTVISNTLPPPPEPAASSNGQEPEVRETNNSAPPAFGPQQTETNPGFSSAPPPSYSQANPGYYPPMPNQQPQNNGYSAYNGYFRPQQPTTNTTVLVQQDRNDADFATGLMIGGALGWGYGHGWGCNSGYGGGGHGLGGWSRPVVVNDTDIRIENHYDMTNNSAAIQSGAPEPMSYPDDICDTGAFESSDFDACTDFLAF